MRELIEERILEIAKKEQYFSLKLDRWYDFYLKNDCHLCVIDKYFDIFTDEELLDLYDKIVYIRHEYQ